MRLLFVTIVSFAIFILVVALDPNSEQEGLDLIGVFALVASVFAFIMLVAALIIRVKVARGAWTEWPASYSEVPKLGGYKPTLILFDQTSGTAYLMGAAATIFLTDALNEIPGSIWLCGEPGRFGVVSPPGGAKPMLAFSRRNPRPREFEKALAYTGLEASDWREASH